MYIPWDTEKGPLEGPEHPWTVTRSLPTSVLVTGKDPPADGHLWRRSRVTTLQEPGWGHLEGLDYLKAVILCTCTKNCTWVLIRIWQNAQLTSKYTNIDLIMPAVTCNDPIMAVFNKFMLGEVKGGMNWDLVVIMITWRISGWYQLLTMTRWTGHLHLTQKRNIYSICVFDK